jgi:hypothetical protein
MAAPRVKRKFRPEDGNSDQKTEIPTNHRLQKTEIPTKRQYMVKATPAWGGLWGKTLGPSLGLSSCLGGYLGILPGHFPFELKLKAKRRLAPVGISGSLVGMSVFWSEFPSSGVLVPQKRFQPVSL